MFIAALLELDLPARHAQAVGSNISIVMVALQNNHDIVGTTEF